MSNPYSPGAQPVPQRPGVVTAAGYLLFAVAALMVLGNVGSLASIGPTRDVYVDAYAGTAAAGIESFLVGVLIFGVVLNLLVAIGYVLLAIFNNRGKNPSRITTWVLGGLSICCTGLGLAGNMANSALTSFSSVPAEPGMPDPEAMARQLEDAIPGWVTPLGLITSVLSLLLLIIVVVLLALPPANDFFRKPVAAWQPPGGAGFPGYPSAYPPPSQSPYPPQPAAPGAYQPSPTGAPADYPPAGPADYPPPAAPQGPPPVSGHPGEQTGPAGAPPSGTPAPSDPTSAPPPSDPGNDSPPRS